MLTKTPVAAAAAILISLAQYASGFDATSCIQKSKQVDVLFVVDVSETVYSAGNLGKSFEFVSKSIEALTVSDDEVNVAVITFAADAHVDSAFNSTYNKTVLDTLLTGQPTWIWDHFPYTGHWDTDGNVGWTLDTTLGSGYRYQGNKLYIKGSNYPAAVSLAGEVVNSAKYGARTNVSKLVVMVTDGNLPCTTSVYEDAGCNLNNMPPGYLWCADDAKADAGNIAGRACYVDQLRTAADKLPSTYAIGVRSADTQTITGLTVKARKTEPLTLGALAGSKVLDADSYDTLASETSQIVSDIIQSELYYCTTTSTTASTTTTTPSTTSTTTTYTGSTSTITTTTSATVTTITTTTPNMTFVDFLETDKKAGDEIFLLLLLLLIPCCGAGYFLQQRFVGNANLEFAARGFTMPTLAEAGDASDGSAPTAINGVASTAAEWNGANEQLLSFGSSTINPQAPSSGSLDPKTGGLHADSANSPLQNGARVGSFNSPKKTAAPFADENGVFIDVPVMLDPVPSSGNGGVAAVVSQEEVARLHAASMGYRNSSSAGGAPYSMAPAGVAMAEVGRNPLLAEGGSVHPARSSQSNVYAAEQRSNDTNFDGSDADGPGYFMASASSVEATEVGRTPLLIEGSLVDPARSSQTNVYAAEQRSNDLPADYDPALQLESAGYGDVMQAEEYQTIMPDSVELTGLSAEQKTLMVAAMAANEQYKANSFTRHAKPENTAVYQAQMASNAGPRSSSMRGSSSMSSDAVYQAQMASNVGRRSSSMRGSSTSPDEINQARRESNVFAGRQSYSEPASPTMLAGPGISAAVRKTNRPNSGGGDGMFETAIAGLQAEAAWRVQEGVSSTYRRGTTSNSTPTKFAGIGMQSTDRARPASTWSDTKSTDIYWASKEGIPNRNRLDSRRRSISYEGALNVISQTGGDPVFQAGQSSREPVSLATIGHQATNWDLPGSVEGVRATQMFEAQKAVQNPAMLAEIGRKSTNWDLPGGTAPTAAVADDYIDLAVPRVEIPDEYIDLTLPRGAVAEADYIDLAETGAETQSTPARPESVAYDNGQYGSPAPQSRRRRLSSENLYDTIVPLQGDTRSMLLDDSSAGGIVVPRTANPLYQSSDLNSGAYDSLSNLRPRRPDSAASRLSSNGAYEDLRPASRLSSNETYDTIVPLRSRSSGGRARVASSASRLSSNDTYEGVMLDASSQSLPAYQPERADSSASRMSSNSTYEGWIPPAGFSLSASAPSLPARNKSHKNASLRRSFSGSPPSN